MHDLLDIERRDVTGLPPAFRPESRQRPIYLASGPTLSFTKRAIDIAVAGLGLLFFLPALIAIAIAVRLDSSGPVFYRQTRTGLGGKTFRILKFRSMRVCESGDAVQQARADDPRVTRIGRFLRASSLDELPQLINVLRGEMSLVGPRPHALKHDEYYGARIEGYWQRFGTRPGITGLAQVEGLRGETRTVEDMARRIDSDLAYLREWNLGRDIAILIRTVGVVLRGDNAF